MVLVCVLCNHPHPRPQGITGWQQIARRASFRFGCRVVPTVSHSISTINAGGMAALLRSETMNTTPSPQQQGLVGSVADETLTLNLCAL